MIKSSEIRKADRPIEPFLLDRWSPCAMSPFQNLISDL
jgi:hypothetical protein